MLRWVQAIALLSVLGSALVLYGVNYQTRRLDADVQARERTLDRIQSEIAVLRADLAFLSRPTRIEAEARRLGMEPVPDRKFIRPESLPRVSGDDANAGVRR